MPFATKILTLAT